MRLLIGSIAFLLLAFTSPSAPVKGQQAPDFELVSPSGKKVKLSKFRGKVVLIDFWASWCRPCRKENPNVVQVYNKYRKSKFKNGKGFVVLSVSLDRKMDDWKKAIEADGLIWKSHGFDKDGAVSSKYGVTSIPTAFLIDGDGEIVAQGGELRGMGLHLALDKMLAE